jgi:hypothetical protein
MSLSLYVDNIKKLSDIGKYQPRESSLINEVTGYLNSLHVDFDGEDPVLYDVPSCSIIELRGGVKKIPIPHLLLNELITESRYNIREDTLLYFTWTRFVAYSARHPMKYRNNFLGFIHYMLQTPGQLSYVTNKINSLPAEAKDIYQQDLRELESIFNDDHVTIE